jgi:hypothetical protein
VVIAEAFRLMCLPRNPTTNTATRAETASTAARMIAVRLPFPISPSCWPLLIARESFMDRTCASPVAQATRPRASGVCVERSPASLLGRAVDAAGFERGIPYGLRGSSGLGAAGDGGYLSHWLGGVAIEGTVPP